MKDYLHGQTYKGDEKLRFVTISSEDKTSLSIPAPEAVPSSQEKKLGANEQDNSLSSSSAWLSTVTFQECHNGLWSCTNIHPINCKSALTSQGLQLPTMHIGQWYFWHWYKTSSPNCCLIVGRKICFLKALLQGGR